MIKDVLSKESSQWDVMRKDVSILYAELFTEHELQQLIAFFKSTEDTAYLIDTDH